MIRLRSRRWLSALAALASCVLANPGAAHADGSAGCGEQVTCLELFLSQAASYADDMDESLSELSSVDWPGFVSSHSEWELGYSDVLQQDVVSDSEGRQYLVWTGAGAIGAASRSADGSDWAWSLVMNDGTVLYPAAETTGDSLNAHMHWATLAFVMANEAIGFDGGTSAMTGEDLRQQGLTADVVSGPAGGPWTFDVTEVSDAGGASASIGHCMLSLSAVDHSYIKFDSSSCW